MMRLHRSIQLLLFFLGVISSNAIRGDDYLDDPSPYWPKQSSPRLTTPQWIGEPGVEAVIVLAIDDMRDPKIYENYLRPILNRLKQIDGRAPVSIMTCSVNPKDPLIAQWLEEGLNLDVHTIDHPCPLLQGGDFAKAKSTYDRCVDLMFEIPGNAPVAFRMPCCDSFNTLSPRFYTEIFARPTPQGKKLKISSSVFHFFSPNDPELTRELVFDEQGRDRFAKYLPAGRGFVNTIENYPYPYLTYGGCLEFPCMAPSDWSAQHLHGVNNQITVDDLKAGLDATVLKQGVFNLVFHPHGWIRNDQVVELIDHAVQKHGGKIKFLNFAEAYQRFEQQELSEGQHLDLNHDGFLDMVHHDGTTKTWDPASKTWKQVVLPKRIQGNLVRPLFATVRPNQKTMLTSVGIGSTKWQGFVFSEKGWTVDPKISEIPIRLNLGPEALAGGRCGIQFRDLDRDGISELLVGIEGQSGIWKLDPATSAWKQLDWEIPEGFLLTTKSGGDAGTRFVDIDEDLHDDLLFSNGERFGLFLYRPEPAGWSMRVLEGKQGDHNGIPPIVRADGTNNGFWVHSQSLVWQNEDTAQLPHLVDRRNWNALLGTLETGPKSPDASLKSIQVKPGLKVELVASEPLLMDPVAFEWGNDGRLWIAEMADYPLGIDGKGTLGGRVRYLEDTDEDGVYDRSTLFLDGLPYPTGVFPWKSGVLVSTAPDVFYAEDTDGDGRADHRETLITGFAEGNQQHRVNGFFPGLDNWIYLANGDSGGVVISPKTGIRLELRGHDLRFKPETGEIELVTGMSQFGRTMDDWGNWFGCNNSNPMLQFVLPDHYLRRNENISYPDPRFSVPEVPGNSPVFPLSRTMARFNDLHTADRFTSACSVMIYRDRWLGANFAGNAFVSEPVHNLVSRAIMSREGVLFRSRRSPEESSTEFLASTDNWFRPTMIKTGPDGAIWIADMYRHVIEHPEWIPPDWQLRLDLRAGHDRGRLYRVVPVASAPRKIPRLKGMSTQEVVALLESPNGWCRDRAQALLVEQGGEDVPERGNQEQVIKHIRSLLQKSSNPLAKLHALGTLDGLKNLQESDLLPALKDPHPGLRRHAIRLCESLPAFTEPILKEFDRLVQDEDPQVLLQLAFTLGQVKIADNSRDSVPNALARLMQRAKGDEYLTVAVLSSLNDQNFPAVLAASLKEGDVVYDLLELALSRGLNGPIAEIVAKMGQEDSGFSIERKFEIVRTIFHHWDDFQAEPDNQLFKACLEICELARLRSDQGDLSTRALALGLLGREKKKRDADFVRFKKALEIDQPTELHLAAGLSLVRLGGPSWELVFSNWNHFGPSTRQEILSLLFNRAQGPSRILEALEKKELGPNDLNAAGRQLLLTHRDPQLRERANKLLDGSIDPDRLKVLNKYFESLQLQADSGRGKTHFEKTCATCHRLGEIGQHVGPDLASLSDRSPETLLIAILDPNRVLESKYQSYTISTRGGLNITGIITGEAGGSMTLVGPDGKSHSIARSEIEEISGTNQSLMPVGIENDLDLQAVADLIAFVRSSAPLPVRREFPGNNPVTRRPSADGSILLGSGHCEIYGSSIILEERFGNLGFWSADDDHVIFNLECPNGGVYEMLFDWACHNESSENRLEISVGLERVELTVPGTGSWEDYEQKVLGKLILPKGKSRVILRGKSPINGALIDLKSIKLIPRKNN